MQRHVIRHVAVAAALFAMPATGALAQTAASAPASPAVHAALTTNTALRGALEKTFDEGQINMLHAVAYQQAVARTCAGFTIDPKRFEREMDLVYDDAKGQPKTLTADEKSEIEKKALFGFGLAYGAQLAIAAFDDKAFCAAARAERKDPPGGHMVWADAK
jgi:hypothetical protein